MPDIKKPVLIKKLTPRNLLSFGPENDGIELQALNVLIGPNGSGKSNLIEAISLMRSTTREFREVIRKGGGVSEWIWKRGTDKAASIDWVLHYPYDLEHLRHVLAFQQSGQLSSLEDERIESEHALPGKKSVHHYYQFKQGHPAMSARGSRDVRLLNRAEFDPGLSILAQRRDPEMYPELAWMAQSYEQIRIYREWSFGRSAICRAPQRSDMRNDMLEEDCSNLGLVLNRLKTRFPKAKQALLAGLNDLYVGIQDFDVLVEGNTVQVFLTENDYTIPATRLSDGTLRYLCLLAILCNPTPPPLICIEEPELGLHPDILPSLAGLLKDAAARTQLIVTTHSDILVDALSDQPESVIICEKHDGRTEMKRLSAEDLSHWLDQYSLGALWIDGQLGGKRW